MPVPLRLEHILILKLKENQPDKSKKYWDLLIRAPKIRIFSVSVPSVFMTPHPYEVCYAI